MILVTGISGVGKTHTVEQFIAEHPTFDRVGASALLANARHSTTDLDAEAAQKNQAFILKALIGLEGPGWDRKILDGHAIIETKDGGYPVPDAVVEALRPQVIVALFDDAASLRQRREQKGRYSSMSLVHLQDAEIHQSRRWSTLLDVPLALIRSGAVDDFERQLRMSGVVF